MSRRLMLGCVACLLLWPRVGGADEPEQRPKPRWALGLRAMVTYEPSGPNQGAVAVNVLPLALDWLANDTFGVRVTPIVNAQLGGAESGLSNLGGGVTVPFYLDKHTTYFVGPYFGATHNLLSKGVELTPAVEGGATWLLGTSFSFTLAAQVGATYFTPTANGSGWVLHPGVFPTVSYRFH